MTIGGKHLSPHVRIERHGPIAHLILDKPEKLNALDRAMWQAFPPLTAELDADDEVKVVIVRGVDARAFAAGADIVEFMQAHSEPATSRLYHYEIHQAQRALHRMTKPTLAMIQGVCIGGGCGIALACDMRFGDPSVRMGITPAKLGLVYSLEDTKRLVDQVGQARARDILYSGRLLPAEEALSARLLDFLVPADELLARVTDYAKRLCANSQHVIRTQKRFIQAILDGQALDDAVTYDQIAHSVFGPDFREGVAAFVAKRAPDFPVR